jgi:hypothetical protein
MLDESTSPNVNSMWFFSHFLFIYHFEFHPVSIPANILPCFCYQHNKNTGQVSRQRNACQHTFPLIAFKAPCRTEYKSDVREFHHCGFPPASIRGYLRAVFSGPLESFSSRNMIDE